MMMREQNESDRAAGRPVSYAPHQFSEVPEHMKLDHGNVTWFMMN